MDKNDILEFAEMIKGSEHTVFFGGAGVSTESGLKDYRSENGIYHTLYYYLTLPLTWRGVLRRDFQAESFKKLSLSAFSSCLNFSANKKFFCSKFTLNFYWQVSFKKEENEWYNVFIRLEMSLRRSERRMKTVGSRRQLLRQQLHRAFHSECPHYLTVAPL